MNYKENKSKRRRAKSFLKVFLALMIGLFCQLFVVDKTEAGEQLYFDEVGNLRMTTYDRIATSSRTYKTIGWTIKRYDAPAGAGNESVVVSLEDDGESQIDPNNPSYKYSFFLCDKETIFRKIGEVSKAWQEELYANGGTVYLDAVMTVCIRDVPQGGLLEEGAASWGRVYDTYEGIAGAENWADAGVLRSHYDKQVYFQGNPQLLKPRCLYQIRYFECFDDIAQVWSMSRFFKDQGGFLELGEEIVLEKGFFDGYDLEFDSARIRTCDINGYNTQRWEHNESMKISFTDETITAITVDLFYKRRERTEIVTDSFQMNGDQVVMDENIIIGAGTPQLQTFNVKEGVPVGADLYALGAINAFGYKVTYKKHSGIRTICVPVDVVYQCQWLDAGGNIQSQRVANREFYYVDRPYAYWEIVDADIQTLLAVELYNYAFDGGMIMMTGLYEPDIILEQLNSHIRLDSDPVYEIYEGVWYGEPSSAVFAQGHHQLDINTMVGQYMVRNDSFAIDGEVFLASNEVTSYAGDPKIGSSGKRIGFERTGLTIPEYKRNGYRYQSDAFVYYSDYESQTATEQESSKLITPVTIHTPVVCHGFLSDDKSFNQLSEPDKGKKTWILGRLFQIGFSTYGAHRNQLGYGEQDYERYVKEYQVYFPFEVYMNGTHYGANRWITCEKEALFYLPTGVSEGEYTVRLRVLAVNAEEGDADEMGEHFNDYISQYGAYEEMQVVVAGRLYGLKITDIQRDSWTDVFYQPNGIMTGDCYAIGLNNENGYRVRNNPLATFPIVRGGNPYDDTEEALPLGTAFTFQITSVGNYKSSEGIYIEPEYYVVDREDGMTRRKVDIYRFYQENGRDVWEEIWYHPESGRQYLKSVNRENVGAVSQNVSDRTAAVESVQRWESSFVIPEDIYVVPEGFDLEAYIERRGEVDVSDDIFYKKGYLMVQFHIYTMKDRLVHLSYINGENESAGYANMWKIEGFANPKLRADGTEFRVKTGDVMLYDLEKNSQRKYKIVGTH